MSEVDDSAPRRRSTRASTSALQKTEILPKKQVRLEHEGQSDVENKDPDVKQEDLVEEKSENVENETDYGEDINLCLLQINLLFSHKGRFNAITEKYSQYDYDSHSMLYWTYNLNCDLRNDLQEYRGQYCFICGCADGQLERCCRDKCLSRYHSDCIDKQVMGEYFAFVNPRRVECPRHYCTTCFAENKRTSAFQQMSSERVYQCKYCTSAYHSKCFPAGCPRNGQQIICNHHVRREFSTYAEMPCCFGCRKAFDKEDPEADKPEICKSCIRTFHSSCAKVNFREDGRCFYCVNKWSPRKGQLCHVLINDKFYPAQVALQDYQNVPNWTGLVPVFLFSKYTRTTEDLELVPQSFIVPMIMFESFEAYYEMHKQSFIFMEKYTSTLQELSFNHLFNLSSKTLKKLPEFKRNQSNQMSSNVRAQMMIQVAAGCDPVKCGCEPVNGFKCIDETCLNRVAGVECSEECKCLNGPAARVVTDAVEIVSVPFGGFGLQTVKPILKGHPIGEYTGTIIDIEKTRALLEKHESQRNQESPLYIMHITGSLHINSGVNGNATRFANHSCNPNAEIVQITGADQMPHQMMFAKRDIQIGESITFDYGHTWSKFNPRCYCASEQCSGHLSSRLRRVLREKKPPKRPLNASNPIVTNRKRKNEKDDPTFAVKCYVKPAK